MPIEALPETTTRALGSSLVLNDAKSVVKELVDNALDAQATAISVEISANTLDIIQVKDNGTGIGVLDRQLLCKRGCTSKIRSLEDLSRLGGSYLGFRGEALASIAELGQAVTVSTRVDGEVVGTSMKYGASGMLSSSSTSHPVGTTIRVQGFLSKIPVRKQTALKETAKTLQAIRSLLFAFAFARPDVRLSMKVLKGKNDKMNWTYAASSGDTLTDVAAKVIGPEIAAECTLLNIASRDCDIEVQDGWRINAVVVSANADPSKIRNATQYVSIDGRPVSTDRGTVREVAKIYKRHIQRSHLFLENSSVSRPFLLMQIQCPPESYDVNVEPAKDEVLFFQPNELLSLVDTLLQRAYGETDQLQSAEVDPDENLADPKPVSKLHRNMYTVDLDDFEGQEMPLTENNLEEAEELETSQTGHHEFSNPFTIAAMTAVVKPKRMDASRGDSLPWPGLRAPSTEQVEDTSKVRKSHPSLRIQEHYLPSPCASDTSATPSSQIPESRNLQQEEEGETPPVSSWNERNQDRGTQRTCLDTWLTPASEVRSYEVQRNGSASNQDWGSPGANPFQMPAIPLQSSHTLGFPSSPHASSRWGSGQKQFKPPSKRQPQSIDSSSSLPDPSRGFPNSPRRFLQNDLLGIVRNFERGGEDSLKDSLQSSHAKSRQNFDNLSHGHSSGSNLELDNIMDFEHRKKAAIAHQRRLAARDPGRPLKEILRSSSQPEGSQASLESEDRTSIEGSTTPDDALEPEHAHTSQKTQRQNPHQNRYLAALKELSHSHPDSRGKRQTPTPPDEDEEDEDEEPRLLNDDPRAYLMKQMREAPSVTSKPLHRTKSSKLPLETIPAGETTLNDVVTTQVFEKLDLVRKQIQALTSSDRYFTRGKTDFSTGLSDASAIANASLRGEWESKLRDMIKTQYRFKARDGSQRDLVPHLKISIAHFEG